VKANVFTPLAEYQLCATHPGDTVAGIYTWIGISGDGTDPNAVLQIGLLKCFDPNDTTGVCDANLRIAWGAGGCNQPPLAHSYGIVAGGLTRPFTVQKVGANYQLLWGANLVATLATSDYRLFCWINNVGHLQYEGERFDGEDSLGTSAHKSSITAMQDFYNGNWHNINIAGCDGPSDIPTGFTPSNLSHCSVSDGNNMSLWTDLTSITYSDGVTPNVTYGYDA